MKMFLFFLFKVNFSKTIKNFKAYHLSFIKVYKTCSDKMQKKRNLW